MGYYLRKWECWPRKREYWPRKRNVTYEKQENIALESGRTAKEKMEVLSEGILLK